MPRKFAINELTAKEQDCCLIVNLFHDGGSYHKENSPLRANQWTGFYMIETPAMKELTLSKLSTLI